MNLIPVTLNPDIHVERLWEKWVITTSLGNIQPKAKEHTRTGLFLGASAVGKIELHASVFADNLPAPLLFELEVAIFPESKSLDSAGLIELAKPDRYQ